MLIPRLAQSNSLWRRLQRHAAMTTLFRSPLAVPFTPVSAESMPAEWQVLESPVAQDAAQPAAVFATPTTAGTPAATSESTPTAGMTSMPATIAARSATLDDTAATGEAEDKNWGRLQTIIQRHRQQQVDPASRPAADDGPVAAGPGEAAPRRRSLETAWPVQVMRAPGEPAAAAHPSDAVTDQPPAAGIPETTDPEHTIRRQLSQVAPQKASESSIELVMPSRPRPTKTSRETLPPSPASPPPATETAAADVEPPAMIATDIGLLPADLWQRLGQTPPQTESQTTTGAAPTPATPYVTRSPEAAGVQAGLPADSLPPARTGDSTPVSEMPPVPAAPAGPGAVPVAPAMTPAPEAPAGPVRVAQESGGRSLRVPLPASVGSSALETVTAVSPAAPASAARATTPPAALPGPEAAGRVIMRSESAGPEALQGETAPPEAEEVMRAIDRAESTGPVAQLVQRDTALPAWEATPARDRIARATVSPAQPLKPEVSRTGAAAESAGRGVEATGHDAAPPPPPGRPGPLLAVSSQMSTPLTRAAAPAVVQRTAEEDEISRAIAWAESATPKAAPGTRKAAPPPAGQPSLSPPPTAANAIHTFSAPVIQRAEAATAAAATEVVSERAEAETTGTEATQIDVDELSRQVYRQLKRRLAIEWERGRGR